MYYQTARDPPHIYWTAEQTYKRLRHEHGNQCIIVTGDSGAGKTESTKHLLKHLVTRSPCEIRKLVETLNHVSVVCKKRNTPNLVLFILFVL